MALKVGDIYLLEHSGFAARVIEPPQGGALAPEGYPVLIETLLLRARWYVNERGEPYAVHDTPNLRLDAKITRKETIETAALLLVIVLGTSMALWVDAYVEALPTSPRVMTARPG